MFQAEARRIERLLYRIARSYLNDDQEAEDAVQDALIKAWEKRKTLRDLSADPRDSGSGGERTAEEEHGALRKPHDSIPGGEGGGVMPPTAVAAYTA